MNAGREVDLDMGQYNDDKGYKVIHQIQERPERRKTFDF